MRLKVHAFAEIFVLVSCLPLSLLARPREAGGATVAPAFVQARFDTQSRIQQLKPGDTVQGKIAQDVFLGDQLIVPKGSRISLTVSRLERRQRGRSVVLPWPVQYFRPKYTKSPVFDFADVTLADGARAQLRVSAVSAIREVRVSPRTKSKAKSDGRAASSSAKASRAGRGGPGSYLELVVERESLESMGVASTARTYGAPARAEPSSIKTVDAGTEAQLALLGRLSASKSRTGEAFKALLIEPLRLNSDLLIPEGTVFEGRVTKRTPARWLSRSGSLHLAFNRLILPAGTSIPIAASVAGVGVDQGSDMKLSSEGGLSGGSLGRARLLVELGVGAGISKVSDDTYQLITEAIVSTATDASTAGAARLMGLALSGAYWLTRRGRDLTLPPYTTFTIRFDRSPALPPSAPAP